MNSKLIIAAYGSLREGQYNNLAFKSHFGKDALTLQGKGTLPLYAMYDLGMYPAVLEDTDSRSTIEVDFLECSAEEVFQVIYDMEIGAGYEAKTIFSTKLNCDVTIYIYKDDTISTTCTLVDEGNWVQYKLGLSYGYGYGD